MNNPTRYVQPLNPDESGLPRHSDGYRLITFAEKYLRVEGKPLVLDEWQKRLLVRVLETDEAGNLRFEIVVVSIPRQNGKSVLAAVLGFYGLLQHHHSPSVLGLARGVEQANIVYRTVEQAVKSNKTLLKYLKPTKSRGISHRKNGGTYKVLAGNADAVQGYPSTFAIVDELHILKPDIWESVVTSQKAQNNALLVGITTAGDSGSYLLQRLYKQGEAAVKGEGGSFGFFVYEAPEGAALTIESITAANPAVACGRIKAEKVLEAEKHSPESNWRRYTLNQFYEGTAEPWVPTEHWYACKGSGVTAKSGLFYSFDVTPGMAYGTVSVTRKADGEVIEHQMVASLVAPTLDRLERIAKRLRDENGSGTYVMDTYVLGPLAKRLEQQGHEVFKIARTGNTQAAGFAFSHISKHLVSHNNDAVLMHQMRHAQTKSTDTGFRIVRGKEEIDAVMSMVYGVYAAGTHKARSLGV